MKKIFYGFIFISLVGIIISLDAAQKQQPQGNWYDRAAGLYKSLTTPPKTTHSEDEEFVEVDGPLSTQLGELTGSIRALRAKNRMTDDSVQQFSAVFNDLSKDLSEAKTDEITLIVKEIYNFLKDEKVDLNRYAESLYFRQFKKEYSAQVVVKVESCSSSKEELAVAQKKVVDRERELVALKEEQRKLQDSLSIAQSQKVCPEVRSTGVSVEQVAMLTDANRELLKRAQELEKQIARGKSTERKLAETEQRLKEFETLERQLEEERLAYEKKLKELEKQKAQCMQRSVTVEDEGKATYDEAVEEMKRMSDELQKKNSEIAKLRIALEKTGTPQSEPKIKKSVNSNGEEVFE